MKVPKKPDEKKKKKERTNFGRNSAHRRSQGKMSVSRNQLH